MEKGHLHHGINARPEAAFAGDLCRIDHVKTRFFLIQGGLDFLGRRDQTSSALYGVLSRKMPPGLQPLGHLVFHPSKLQLVAADEISLRNQIR